MSDFNRDAPRSLVSLVWSVAAILGVFLAVIVSSFFVLKYYFPVSADNADLKPVTTTGKCSEGESRVAIHNYPGITAIAKAYPKLNPADYQHGPVEKALGGYYQCSMICVPNIDQAKPINDQANLGIIGKYLEGGTVGGKPMVFAKSGDEFVGMVKTAKKTEELEALKRVVIMPYSKDICAGYAQGKGQSVDYAEIKVKSGAVKIEEPNETVKQAEEAAKKREEAAEAARQKAAEAAKQEAPSTSGPQPIAKDPGKVTIATNKDESESSSADTENQAKARRDLGECIYNAKLINNKITANTAIWRAAGIQKHDLWSSYTTLEGLYGRWKTTKDPVGDLKICVKLRKNYNKMNDVYEEYRSKSSSGSEDEGCREVSKPPSSGESATSQRSWNDCVNSFWNTPFLGLSTVYANQAWQTHARGSRLYATWVKIQKSNIFWQEKFWSMNANGKYYFYNSEKAKWMTYVKRGSQYSGGYPDYMPGPFTEKYIFD